MFPAQRILFISCLLLAVLAQAPAAAGQSRKDVVAQELDVRLAEIEVVAVDRDGNAVDGLTREDFEVLQNGELVELTHFGGPSAAQAEASGADAGSEAEAAGAGRDSLSLIVYIDRAYLELGDLEDVRAQLKPFLRRSLGSGDRVMLVSAERSMHVHQAMTTVPELVVTRLDEIKERAGGGRFGKEYQNILRDMRRIKSQGNDLDARDPTLPARGFFSQVQAFSAEVQGELRQTADQLSQLIQTLAGLPGRRAVLYIGGGVPAVYSQLLFDAWDETFGRNSNLQIPDTPGGPGVGAPGADGVADAGSLAADNVLFDSLASAGPTAMADAARIVADVAKLASAHDVIFHTIDARALRGSASTFSISGEAALGARGTVPSSVPARVPGSLSDSLGSLRDLALSTGGRAFSGSRNFDLAFERLGRDFEAAYTLGFEPLPTDGDARIEVRLRDRRAGGKGKLRLRHRKVLRLKDRDTEAAERTVSALLLEELENPLAVELEAGEPSKTGKREIAVPVSISVPLARLALVADGKNHTGRLSIFATSGGLERVGSVVKAVVPVRIANQDLLTSLGRRVAYQLELTLPGPERIAVTVRDDFRPMSSTAAVSLIDPTRSVEPSASEAGR
ncbi:MAG: VWA domain-containing protein [Acidobacteriota bacterium]